MATNQNYVLFTAADPIYAFVPTRKDFEYHLLMNLLFEEKLMMHEGYIINSPFLAEHIGDNPRGKSLFEIAAENGLIIPAYRQRDTDSLREAITIMEAAHSRKTILHLSTEKQIIRDRLCESVDKGGEVFYWPNEKLSMGESYQNLLFDKLRNESSVLNAIESYNEDGILSDINLTNKSIHEKLWDDSVKWRTRLLDDAASATIARGQTGIQRAEIFRLLAEDLKVEDVQKMKDSHRNYDEAQAFFRWINHCHQLNIANFLGAAPYLLKYNFTQDFIASEFFSGTTTSSWEATEPIHATVSFPKLDLLMKGIQENPYHFIELRNKEAGKEYRRSLNLWRINPTYRNREELLNVFTEYCKDLCKYYLKGSKPNRVLVILGNTLSMIKPVLPGPLKIAANIVTKILGSTYKITNCTETDIHIYHPLNKLNLQTE